MGIIALQAGPKGTLILGNLPDFARDPITFLNFCAHEYGDAVALRFGPKRAVLLKRPEHIEAVLVTQRQAFAKPYRLRTSRVWLSSQAENDAADLLRRSQLSRTAFHRNTVHSFGTTMVQRTEQMVSTWEQGEVRDVLAEMMQLTFAIVTTTLFGVDATEHASAVHGALAIVMDAFLDRLRSPFVLPERVPSRGNRRVLDARRTLDAVVDAILEEWRAGRTDGGALLSLLTDSKGGPDQPIDWEHLRDEALTLLLAGHETVGLALTWIWYLLAEHPAVEDSLVAEVRRVLGDRAPTADDWPHLTVAQSVVREALRLYPPLWVLGRVAREDCEIGGHRLRAGTLALMSPWLLHRDERFFAEPATFCPERWDHNLAAQLPRYAYLPFGGGARGCIGSGFAMLEAVLVLVTMIQRHHLTLAPGQAVTPLPSITLRPGRAVRMVVHPRCR